MTHKPTYDALLHRVDALKKEALEKETLVDQLVPIFRHSLDLIGSGNLQGFFTKVNPSFEKMLGYPEEEFLNKPFLDFVHPGDQKITQKALTEAANGKPVIFITNRYRCHDGSFKWIDWRVQAFTDENLFIAVGRDITEKKTLENELRQSERIYRNILQMTDDGFIQTDDQGLIRDCNSAYLKMTGYTRDELLGMRISDVEAAETTLEIRERIKKLIHSGWDCFESIHKRKDATTFPVEVSITYIAQEKTIIAFIKDITERKRILATIFESEERFRQLAENIPEVFWLGSLDWQEVYYISPAYEHIWEKTCESLYRDPLSWLDSVVEEDVEMVRKAFSRKLNDDTSSIAFPDYRIQNSTGEIRWIRARAFPIRKAAGKPYRIAGIAVDVTSEIREKLEKAKLVEELQKALEQVKRLTGFLPVCSSCKKIRDVEGQWENIESYIARHSEAEFTHSLCPECALKYYPEYVDLDKLKKK